MQIVKLPMKKPLVHIPENVTRAILLMSLALQSKRLLGSGQR